MIETISEPVTRVHVLWGGTGGTASKLAQRLRKYVINRDATTLCHFGTLNSASLGSFLPNDVVLVVVSTTGKGQFPQNALHFIENMHAKSQPTISQVHYSVFGLGDSGYELTFNAAAVAIGHCLDSIGALAIGSQGVTKSDVALEKPPSSAFKTWWEKIEHSLDGGTELDTPNEADPNSLDFALLHSFDEGVLHFSKQDHVAGRILQLSLETTLSYQEMSVVRLVPQNSFHDVNRVMRLLGPINENETVTIASIQSFQMAIDVGVRDFLIKYADLSKPFRRLEWRSSISPMCDKDFKEDMPAVDFLERVLPKIEHAISVSDASTMLLSMTPQRPRCYSIASSLYGGVSSTESESFKIGAERNSTAAEILMRVISNGRLSSQTLCNWEDGSTIRYKIEAPSQKMQQLIISHRPVVAVACGTGFGPIRGLIQRRIKQAMMAERDQATQNSELPAKMSLFLGYKSEDSRIFLSIVDKALLYNLLDAVHLVPSNEEKIRVQDYFIERRALLLQTLVDEQGWIHVCGNAEMVEDAKERMKMVLGVENWSVMVEEERLVEEVF